MFNKKFLVKGKDHCGKVIFVSFEIKRTKGGNVFPYLPYNSPEEYDLNLIV